MVAQEPESGKDEADNEAKASREDDAKASYYIQLAALELSDRLPT